MYFFDFEDYCGNNVYPVIGPNAINIFTTPLGGICEDLASTQRATRDALYNMVTQWYNQSNPISITYQFTPSQTLTWPSSTATYTLYTGGFTSFDEGYSIGAIPLPAPFTTNGQTSKNLYISTNGYFTIGTGDGVIHNSPNEESNPATMAANPGDNWLQPGASLSDTTTQNAYYKTGDDGYGKYFVKLLVYAGTYNNITAPTSWIANYYIDTKYQWLEVMIKSTSTVRGTAGPYNVNSVSSAPTTATKVWRGDLNGQNWEYLGLGTVSTPEIMPRSCPECDTLYNNFMATYTSTNFFWGDAVNNFQNITEPQYQLFITTMYNNMCMLKNLMNCVDGDTFDDFII